MWANSQFYAVRTRLENFCGIETTNISTEGFRPFQLSTTTPPPTIILFTL